VTEDGGREKGEARMSSITEALDQLIDAFLSDRVDFMSFWRSFMDKWAAADISPTDLGAYEEAYEIVYMGAPGPPRAVDRAVGILSEEEVRVRLSAFRKRSSLGET
jgi:hypothetical protein